ncbi:OmpA family protein [Schleiferiaceae bacterium]|nr:OmpA family protein [Schleiferiaceae bacterium]
MVRFYQLVFALLFLSLSTFGQSRSAINAFQKAQDAFRSGEESKGWKYLEKSMKKGEGAYYQPFIYAGDLSFQKGQYVQSINYYDQAIEISPVSTIYLKKSMACKYSNQWDLGIESLRQYLTNARFVGQRRKEAEQMLLDLIFTKDSYKRFTSDTFNYNIQKLSFSTEQLEYFPTISGGDDHLVYTHRHILGTKPSDENLFEGALDGITESGEPLGGYLNSSLNEGASSVSADGQFMVLTVCNRQGGAGSCDLYYSHWNSDFGWERPEPLPGEINTGRWESQPSLGPDGRTIYFVRGRNSKSKDKDIFLSVKDSEGNWSKGTKLPANINSPASESCPFIHFDGLTLYFLSERSPSLGASDFFKSVRVNDTTWSKPVNMGFPLNSYGEEFSLVIDKSGTFGYLSSERGSALVTKQQSMYALDLYRFDLPEHLQPEKRFNYDLLVVDSITEKPIGSARVQLYNDNGVQFFAGESHKNSGIVRLMSDGSFIRITAYKKGYMPYSSRISTTVMTARPMHGQEFAARIKMTPIEIGKSFCLRNVLFDLDKSSLLPESEKELKSLLITLTDNPNLKATIIGHTDNQGSRKYNQALSEARAQAVLNWLVDHGIKALRLSFEGRGMDEPVAENETEWGRGLNRRTEVQLR